MAYKHTLDHRKRNILYSFCIALIHFYSGFSLEKVDKLLSQEEVSKIKNIIEDNILNELNKLEKQRFLSYEQIVNIIEIIRSIEQGNQEKVWDIQNISENISAKSQKTEQLFELAKSYFLKKTDLRTRSHTKKEVFESSVQIERSLSVVNSILDYVLNNLESGAITEHDNVKNRYLNCGFCSVNSEEIISTSQALNLEVGSYRLKINIGKFWGIGTSNVPIPDKLLKPFFEEQEYIELDVSVSSLNVEIEEKPKKLKLPSKGDSEYIFFDLKFTLTKRCSINIDLLFKGNLLQSKRVEVDVLKNVEDTPRKSAFPVQDAYTTWTRLVSLNPQDLALIKDKPRRFTIVVERDSDNRIGFRFYNNEEIDIHFEQRPLTDAQLINPLTALRKQLSITMDEYHGTIGGTEKILLENIEKLAVQGQKLRNALFSNFKYPLSQLLNVNLQPKTVIQVAPLSTALGIPWELLYERKLESYKEGRFKLCSTWLQHGLKREDCPSYGTEEEETTICPHSFWGYRYIIEQLPCKLEPHKPLPKHSLPLFIRNNLPLILNATVSTELKGLDYHWQELQKLASREQLKILLTDSREKLKRMIKTYDDHPVDILYFYTHGGINEFDYSPYLGIGDGDKIESTDLEAWEVNFERHQPLIILNACDSANYTPNNFENLLQSFFEGGAAGVIGTQCEIREKLANAFIIKFFQSFLQQTTAGEALFNSRQTLLREDFDPRGLAYSLFASADIKLAQSIINS